MNEDAYGQISRKVGCLGHDYRQQHHLGGGLVVRT